MLNIAERRLFITKIKKIKPKPNIYYLSLDIFLKVVIKVKWISCFGYW